MWLLSGINAKRYVNKDLTAPLQLTLYTCSDLEHHIQGRKLAVRVYISEMTSDL